MLGRLFKQDKPDICPNCGNACAVSDVFCPKCGRNLDELFEGVATPANAATAVPLTVPAVPHYEPPMLLGPLAHILVFGGTLLTMLFPLVYGLFWILSLPSFWAPGDTAFSAPVFRYFGLIWYGACCTGLMQLGLMVFYLTHILKNTAAAETARILLGVGVFLLPQVAMPAYYYLYLRNCQPPPWALARPGRPARPVLPESSPPAADISSEQPQPTPPAEPPPSESEPEPAPQSPLAPESTPQALAPGSDQLLADLLGENYHAKLAALRHVRDYQITAAPILETLRRLADSADDRYLRDLAKKTLRELPATRNSDP
jgi:hypothetical protein